MQERKNCFDGSCVLETVTKKEESLQDEEERRPRQSGKQNSKKMGDQGERQKTSYFNILQQKWIVLWKI